MSDFVPPSGPPPPKVPEGWKAQWNDQYKEWFYVNIYTKKSQWDKPTEPVYPHSGDSVPEGPPPGYTGSGSHTNVGDTKSTTYGSTHSPANPAEDDAALAARLQAEEDQKAAGTRGAQQDYQNTPYQELPPRDAKKSGGFLGKLLGKASGSGTGSQYQQGGYGGNQYRPQQQSYYGGAPQQQYGGYGPQGGGYPPQGYQQPYGGGYGGPPQQYGGYPPQGGYGGGYQQQAPPRKSGGLGTAGGAALGLGGGLIGGMLLEDAIQGHDQNEYNQGYEQGQDSGGGDGGGDYGGGDDGGGGGDF